MTRNERDQSSAVDYAITNDPSFEAFYKNELEKQKNVFDGKSNLLKSINCLLHKTLKEKEEDLIEAKRELKELSQVFKVTCHDSSHMSHMI